MSEKYKWIKTKKDKEQEASKLISEEQKGKEVVEQSLNKQEVNFLKDSVLVDPYAIKESPFKELEKVIAERGIPEIQDLHRFHKEVTNFQKYHVEIGVIYQGDTYMNSGIQHHDKFYYIDRKTKELCIERAGISSESPEKESFSFRRAEFTVDDDRREQARDALVRLDPTAHKQLCTALAAEQPAIFKAIEKNPPFFVLECKQVLLDCQKEEGELTAIQEASPQVQAGVCRLALYDLVDFCGKTTEKTFVDREDEINKKLETLKKILGAVYTPEHPETVKENENLENAENYQKFMKQHGGEVFKALEESEIVLTPVLSSFLKAITESYNKYKPIEEQVVLPSYVQKAEKEQENTEITDDQNLNVGDALEKGIKDSLSKINNDKGIAKEEEGHEL